jgi:ferredoxin
MARVTTGAGALRPPSKPEAETLVALEAESDQRLLCQVILSAEADVEFEL